MAGQVVDTQTAEEFMQQVLQQVSVEEMGSIERAAARKRDLFLQVFDAPMEHDGLLEGLRAMFGVRRRAGAILESAGTGRLAGLIADLRAPGSPAARVDAFTAELQDFSDVAPEIASEILHFTAPDEYWLWTRWMWDPRTETGSLRLVTMDEFDLSGATPGQTYLRVGEAVAFAAETGHAVGFAGQGPFGLDVFLACVYGIYMYTVLRMRMTQEFNHVVPPLPELARRLLGVYRMEA